MNEIYSNKIYIGTSGWVYKEWAADFFKGIKLKEQFEFYATQFPTVEINATFYRLPSLSIVHGWRKKAPPGFHFAITGSRYITHIKRLNNLSRSVGLFVRRIQPLKHTLGPFLWQLPPNLKLDLPRLEKFLAQLPVKHSHALEFRHPAWLTEKTFALLRQYHVANVAVSSRRIPPNFTVTADFIYIRFHGLADGARHDYTPEELAPWAQYIQEQAGAGRNVFAYFNNDFNLRAPQNAKLLMQMCGHQAIQPFASPVPQLEPTWDNPGVISDQVKSG